MPLFLDRHDVPGATPEDLATAHARDVLIEKQYGVRYLTYWFDDTRGTAFCLIDGPDIETVNAVHRDSHGLVAARILAVDGRLVRSFMGAILEPAPNLPFVNTAFRAILFTDVVGSTALAVQVGDARAMEMMRAHDAIVRAAISDCHGFEVKHTGDGIMASFTSVIRAVECGLEIQANLAERNLDVLDPVHVRIGISCGEPVTEEGDLFGAAVALAARLTAIGQAGEILVSAAVRELCVGKGFQFVDRGTTELKGFEQPVTIYRLNQVAASTKAPDLQTA